MFKIRVSPLTREMLLMAREGPPERAALISIMDHKRDCTERYPVERVLRLCFDDAVDTRFWQNLMTGEQADAICSFVLKFGRELDWLVIHCSEGRSRSPAIAAGILGGLRQDESEIWNNPDYQPNPYVYRLVLEAFTRGVRWKNQ
ncbi:MAG: hypothetical protein VB062_02705 [Christensenella sp.]|nr:hypothetical protein [Christensenella sp.]